MGSASAAPAVSSHPDAPIVARALAGYGITTVSLRPASLVTPSSIGSRSRQLGVAYDPFAEGYTEATGSIMGILGGGLRAEAGARKLDIGPQEYAYASTNFMGGMALGGAASVGFFRGYDLPQTTIFRAFAGPFEIVLQYEGVGAEVQVCCGAGSRLPIGFGFSTGPGWAFGIAADITGTNQYGQRTSWHSGFLELP